ncbi:2-keto-4-pentenoate hydratase [Bacillus norwichensis]|uniref:Fumarylacetoacetate hydrolase family protein n=1 Tax=Bacillus norwichensis TaxID=2762217 RepID=A0ABR8VG74_9BACI|nr:fumarylacetoacetate hydrolase family protein [Bacillus norwichensis]MBD8003738.1 fumarylacetoacetate hydrolase family protein [Bacillus norwichensis]
MASNSIEKLADYLWDAEQTGQGVQALTKIQPELSIREAYQVQMHNIDKKVKDGQKIIGKKIGLTSLAMQKLLGVDQPDYGHLLDEMLVENGDEIPFSRVMQPKVEGEIAFVLKEDLVGPTVSTEDVLRATDYILPSIEIVDSRVKDWKIKLPDTIADNASCGLYVLGGQAIQVSDVDLLKVGMVLKRNGEIVNTGVGAAALGNPAYAVAWLANKLHEFGIVLKAGEVILSGALSAAVDAQPGDTFSIEIDQLGEVNVKFSRN